MAERPRPTLAGSRYLRSPKRMRLSKAGEIRALTRKLAALAKFTNEPEVSDLWRQIERSFTMAEIADIEIIEPSIRIDNEVTINLDIPTTQAVYALAWTRFEESLVTLNALYNETPSEGQEFAFNRVKRMLWAARDIERYANALFAMTAMPEDFDPDAKYDDEDAD